MPQLDTLCYSSQTSNDRNGLHLVELWAKRALIGTPKYHRLLPKPLFLKGTLTYVLKHQEVKLCISRSFTPTE